MNLDGINTSVVVISLLLTIMGGIVGCTIMYGNVVSKFTELDINYKNLVGKVDHIEKQIIAFSSGQSDILKEIGGLKEANGIILRRLSLASLEGSDNKINETLNGHHTMTISGTLKPNFGIHVDTKRYEKMNQLFLLHREQEQINGWMPFSSTNIRKPAKNIIITSSSNTYLLRSIPDFEELELKIPMIEFEY